MRWLTALLVVATGAAASAHSTGITGASGKSGFICNACHSGGATPTVQLSGPTTLAAGASGTYTLTITGGAAVAGGLDAALDDASLGAGASLATVSAHTQLAGGEITHTQPVAFSANALSFQFTVAAPASARTMTLWAAGNSTNDNGSSTGDQAAGTSMTITVTGGAAPPDLASAPPADLAGAPPGADLAGVTNPPDAASDLGITPTPSGRDLATPVGGSGSAEPPAGGPSPSASGCSLAPSSATSSPLGALALAVALAFAISRRARRRCASPAP